jgi:hypothetical protein
MAPADHTYRVRPASSADLPAVLAILAESRAERPGWAVPSAGGPSRRQEAAWERVLATADLTVYLAESGSEAAGTASMLLMPHLTYDCRPTAFIEAVAVRYAHRRRGSPRCCSRPSGTHRPLPAGRSSCCRTSATTTTTARTTCTARRTLPRGRGLPPLPCGVPKLCRAPDLQR